MVDHASFALAELYTYFLIFSRFGAFLFAMPGTSEGYVPPRVRLWLALAISFVLAPVVGERFPAMPGDPLISFGYLFQEAVIGYFAGIFARILLSALDVAGSIFSLQVGFASAFGFSPASAQQSSLPAVLLSASGLALIFVMDVHHAMIRGLVDSYSLFAPGQIMAFANLSGDLLRSFTGALAASFLLALQIVAPVVVVMLLVMLAAGMINRLMPQVQVFFVLQPLQIMLGFLILLWSLRTILAHFMDVFGNGLQRLWVG
ncbi:MAG: flagellar biosynthetic protein FliR [Holosporales bacterium]